jgi:hypothetical protein
MRFRRQRGIIPFIGSRKPRPRRLRFSMDLESAPLVVGDISGCATACWIGFRGRICLAGIELLELMMQAAGSDLS